MSDVILPIPAIPPGLREAAQRGTLIPFVGAGASRLAGCPTWVEFADRALKACVEAGKFSYGQLAQVAHLSPRVKLSIVRGIQAEHSLSLDYAKLINPVEGYEHETGRRVYQSLARLGQTFITTNYDGWLDNELADAKATIEVPGQQEIAPTAPKRRQVHADPNEFTAANLNQPQSVFHLHGTLAQPADMVITTRDYITRYANDRQGSDPKKENRTLTFLDHLFGYKTVLFVGYGLEDLEILEYVIQKARLVQSSGQTEARHFMLQGYFSHEYELMKSLRQYYKQCDIQLLPFLRDKRDWYQLIEVLDKFAEVMPAAQPMHLQKLLEMESLLDE